MSPYSPPYSINDAMLACVSSISETVGEISIQNKFKTRPHLRKNNTIKSVYASLKIEANSMSLNQVRDVIDGHLVLGNEKEIQEVKNAYAAYADLSSIDPYSIESIKRVHSVVTRNTVNQSGEFRTGEEGVFNGDICIFMAPPARLVPQLMDDLFQWMKNSQNVVHPLILSCVFHYEFVFIHPFTDGNGRMARLWHTAILAKWKPLFQYVPLESQIELFQEDYYAAIAMCHTVGSSNYFIEFMLKQIDSVLRNILNTDNDSSEILSEYVERMLSVMDYDVPYTPKTLMKQLNLKSRETFRIHYLSPALKLGLVTMTIPDKPKSKNQRYVKR